MYYVYILKCADSTLYTGITTNTKRREKEHNTSNLGAKYTKARRPVRIVYAKEEIRIKKFTRKQKLELIEKNPYDHQKQNKIKKNN